MRRVSSPPLILHAAQFEFACGAAAVRVTGGFLQNCVCVCVCVGVVVCVIKAFGVLCFFFRSTDCGTPRGGAQASRMRRSLRVALLKIQWSTNISS